MMRDEEERREDERGEERGEERRVGIRFISVE
jgi:hypothetical protein